MEAGTIHILQKLAGFAGKYLWFKRKVTQARKQAIEGEDLTQKGTLSALIDAEIKNLVSSSDLPQQLKGRAIRDWLLRPEHVNLIAEIVASQSGGTSPSSMPATERLAAGYANATGERQELAVGPINLVVSSVIGTLQSTPAGKLALQHALMRRVAGQLEGRVRSPGASLTDEQMRLLRNASIELLAIAKQSWNVGAFIAPLNCSISTSGSDSVENGTTLDISRLVSSERNVLLIGPGGIGKTTLLLEVCELINGKNAAISFFADAALWCQSGVGMLDYLASTLPVQAAGISVQELTLLAKNGRLILVVNGWNEIPASRRSQCRDFFLQFTTSLPDAMMIVSSRTVAEGPPFQQPVKVEVRGLGWSAQRAMVRARLADDAAPLLEMLAKHTRLRHAARSPLILRGLIAQVVLKEDVAYSTFDILGAVVREAEDGLRKDILEDSPVFGRHAEYLEELACRMNFSASTSFKLDAALVALTHVGEQLSKKGLLSEIPQPAVVLKALASHHVLHFQDDSLRFSHHRLQEYFGAKRILETLESTPNIAMLAEAANEPGWGDSLELVADHLSQHGRSELRAALVAAAATNDIAFACDLAGQSGFIEADDRLLFQSMLDAITKLSASSLAQVRQLGLVCKISSRFLNFSSDLWSVIENENFSTRVDAYRLNGLPISLSQLGADARERIRTWSSDLQIEFIHECAANSHNYDFVVMQASSSADSDIRRAAICALLWNYPASTAGTAAWLAAPFQVQTHAEILSHISYLIEEDDEALEVRERLKEIIGSGIPQSRLVKLALSPAVELGPVMVPAILEALASTSNHSDSARLVALASEHAGDKVKALAIQLAAEYQRIHSWAMPVLLGQQEVERAQVFETLWVQLGRKPTLSFESEAFGPLASAAQTQRALDAWLRHFELPFEEREAGGRELADSIERLLRHMPGKNLFISILECVENASYESAVEMLRILHSRITVRAELAARDARWCPTQPEFIELARAFGEVERPTVLPENGVTVYLALIASRVSASENSGLLLKALQQHLDGWTKFYVAADEWTKNRSGTRPQNPSLGTFVREAFLPWGEAAFPSLTKMLLHPHAAELVPEILVYIANKSWEQEKDGLSLSSINTDIECSLRRQLAGRVLRLPTEEFQELADGAGVALANLLNELLQRELQAKADDPTWNLASARYRLGRIGGSLANFPSEKIVQPLMSLLSSGLIGAVEFVGAIRGLIRQGWIFSERSIVLQFETLYDEATQSPYSSEYERYSRAQMCQLMLLVEPSNLLSNGLSHYLAEWHRHENVDGIARTLEHMKSEKAWDALIAIAALRGDGSELSEPHIRAICASLTVGHFPEFLRLIESGEFFAWCSSPSAVSMVAPLLFGIAGLADGNMSLLIDACKKNGSDYAHAMLMTILREADLTDELRVSLAVDELDSVNNVGRPALTFDTVLSAFKIELPLGGGSYEVQPRACNSLRLQLYLCAKDGAPPASSVAKDILAALECYRREYGRPSDEPRHPYPEEGGAWTYVLIPTASASVRAGENS